MQVLRTHSLHLLPPELLLCQSFRNKPSIAHPLSTSQVLLMFGTLLAPIAELSWRFQRLEGLTITSVTALAITTAAMVFIVALQLFSKSPMTSQSHKAIPRSPDSPPILYDTLSLIKHRDDFLD